jgi:peptidoglycan lytic transglycosylase
VSATPAATAATEAQRHRGRKARLDPFTAGATAGVILCGIFVTSACVHRYKYKFPPSQRPSVGTVQTGVASWYGPQHHGRKTSSGERFDMNDLTAAHATYAFGTRVRVTLLATGRSVEVRINDRFPNYKGRVIDLSRAAAREIGLMARGTGKVRLEVVGPSALNR